MAMKNNYWTCSKFADWLRGTAKPFAASSEEWRDWKRQAKEAHPFRYWLADEGLNHIQDVVCYVPNKANDIRYYINNRWVDKSHALVSHAEHCKRGEWHNVGHRMLPCLFSELVDYVEVEAAWHHVAWDKDAAKKYGRPWWRRWYRNWRCPEAGIENLEWSAGLVFDKSWGVNPGDPKYGLPTHQAEGAREVLRLYRWWKEVYPNRPDPHDISGWSAHCESQREKNGGDFFADYKTEKERRESHRILNRLRKIEAAYEKEDTEMLIALIKIRLFLWT